METLNIGEVARRAGMQTSAIRYYESIGLLLPPPRASGWRQYDPDVVERLEAIRTARQMGFTLKEISMLLDGFSSEIEPSARWRALAERKLAQVEDMIQRAMKLKTLLEVGLDCGCARVEVCIISEGDDCLPVVAA